MKLNWYLIESEARMMIEAKRQIEARGVEFFLALSWRRERLTSGRCVAVPYPRLPGNYAFVRLSDEARDETIIIRQAAAIKLLRGVREVYRTAQDKYAVVPREDIKFLRDAGNDEQIEASRARWKPKVGEEKFRPGQMVRILRHPIAEGQIAEFLYSVRGSATLAVSGKKIVAHEADLEAVAMTARASA